MMRQPVWIIPGSGRVTRECKRIPTSYVVTAGYHRYCRGLNKMKEELEKRIVKGPDGFEFEVEPLRDYYCESAPTVMPPAYIKIVENLFNWARSESI